MKKVLSLLTLLLAVCSGAWADEVQATLFHWAYDNTSSVTSITNSTVLSGVTGGTITPTTTNDSKAFSAKDKISSYASGTANDMKAAGSAGSNAYYLKNGSGALSLKVELASGTFKAGDIVQICGTGNWNVSTVNNLGGKDGDVITKIETGSTSAFTVASGTIPAEFVSSNTIYLARQDGTTCGICAIKITRAKTVTSRTLTGINVNGTAWDISGLNENAAAISTEYAGPPTAQFVYSENYDDATSATELMESITAVKSGAHYVATSTVLTTNVSLTFTNVSNVLFSMTDPTAPTEALASQASSAVTATFSPGGSATVFNGHGSNEAQMVYNGAININGSGNSYFKASFTSPLAEGDVITSSNTTGAFYISQTNNKSNSQTMPYTIPKGSELIGKRAVYFQKNGGYDFTWLTITRPKTIDTQELGGVKEGETTLTETTDYTVSSTTITLTEVHKAIAAPTDIKLINHITYDDATTEDKDVDVTLVKNGEFFEGTATIGAETYTVKVPVDNSTPLLSLSAASGAITLNSFTPTGTATVTLTGANLTNGTFNAPTADGVTVTPASVEITDGTLSQVFTITSSATTEASTVLNFAYTGATTQTYTLTYSKTAMGTLAQENVTAATTWDWSKVGEFGYELTASTSPSKSEFFLMANMPEITGTDASFNKQALQVMCQYPTRGSDHYFQGSYIKFVTTVPGYIDVDFSNTGGSRPYRYLNVNGVNTEFKDNTGTKVSATGIKVPAGEVVIKGYIPDASDPQERSGDDVGDAMIRIYKIDFTPITSETATIATSGYTTFASAAALDFANAEDGSSNKTLKAYVVSEVSKEAVTLKQVTSAPANTGVVLMGTASTEYTIPVTDTPEVIATNELTAVVNATTVEANTVYVVSGGKFCLYTGTSIPAGKAYLLASKVPESARDLSMVFTDDSQTTGINVVESAKTINGIYNLNGQRISQPTKGLYIMNGKKVMVK